MKDYEYGTAAYYADHAISYLQDACKNLSNVKLSVMDFIRAGGGECDTFGGVQALNDSLGTCERELINAAEVLGALAAECVETENKNVEVKSDGEI